MKAKTLNDIFALDIPCLFLYLVGKKSAHLAELAESSEASIKEISMALDFPENYTRALLSELLSKGLIKRNERGLYEVDVMRVREILSMIESKLK